MSFYDDVNIHIRDAIKNGITDYGTIHTHRRYSSDWSKFINHFKCTVKGKEQYRAWIVTIAEDSPIIPEIAMSDTVIRVWNFIVIGILGIEDSSGSEKTFWNMVESVIDVLDNASTISHGEVPGSVGPVAARLYNMRMFGSVGCHYVEIHVPVKQERAVA